MDQFNLVLYDQVVFFHSDSHDTYSGTPLVGPPLKPQKSGLSIGVASHQG